MTPTAALILESIAADFIGKHPELAGRVAKGLQLAKVPGAVTAIGAGLYRVAGGSGASYQVAKGYCECADHSFRPELRCKHRLCVAILSRAGALPEPVVAAEENYQVELLEWLGIGA